MPIFSYIAINNKGDTVNNSTDQLDRNGVIEALVKQGLRPISIKELKTKSKADSVATNVMGGNKVKPDQLVMFTRQLSAMVGAGVPILRALSALRDHISESPALKRILTNIIHDVEGGTMLGDSMAKYPNTFNDVYVNMVRAGEAAGILDEILKRIASQQEKSMTMRKKIKGAMAYPIVLMAITILAFFGLMLFVVPQIGKIIKDLGGGEASLPAITLIMLGVSDFFIRFWWLILAIMFIIIFGFIRITKTAKGRLLFHKALLKMPIVNKIVTKVAVAHFSRTFSALMEAGVAVLEALSVTSRAVGNAVFEQALVNAEADVKNGRSLSSVIESYTIFPPIVSQMLSVGEETGQTEKVLIKVADFYEEEVDTAIGSISSIIEPVMIVIMGGMVGLIAASVMMPIAGLTQQIK